VRRTALVVICLALVALAPATASAGLVTTYEGEFTGWGQGSGPTPGTATIVSLTAQITCPVGVTFLGRGNATQNGETKFIGKFRGTCTGSAQQYQTVQGQSFGALACSSTWVARGQIQFSDGVKIRLPGTQFPIICF
jgi:hypothetical protein